MWNRNAETGVARSIRHMFCRVSHAITTHEVSDSQGAMLLGHKDLSVGGEGLVRRTDEGDFFAGAGLVDEVMQQDDLLVARQPAGLH